MKARIPEQQRLAAAQPRPAGRPPIPLAGLFLSQNIQIYLAAALFDHLEAGEFELTRLRSRGLQCRNSGGSIVPHYAKGVSGASFENGGANAIDNETVPEVSLPKGNEIVN